MVALNDTIYLFMLVRWYYLMRYIDYTIDVANQVRAIKFKRTEANLKNDVIGHLS
ncbi:MAG: hypothetical protein ACI9QV_001447 [Methylophagaceae bacterium]|jgi:hypothetical protein